MNKHTKVNIPGSGQKSHQIKQRGVLKILSP